MGHNIESPEYRSRSSFGTATDESLVATAQSGGYSAYAELCRRHRESVFRTLQRITKNAFRSKVTTSEGETGTSQAVHADMKINRSAREVTSHCSAT